MKNTPVHLNELPLNSSFDPCRNPWLRSRPGYRHGWMEKKPYSCGQPKSTFFTALKQQKFSPNWPWIQTHRAWKRQKMIFTEFSHAFWGTAKISAVLNRRLKVLSTCIYIFHCNHSPLQHCAVLLLLFYSPGSCFPCKTSLISLHKPPRMVNKLPDDFNQASIKNLKSHSLAAVKFAFGCSLYLYLHHPQYLII